MTQISFDLRSVMSVGRLSVNRISHVLVVALCCFSLSKTLVATEPVSVSSTATETKLSLPNGVLTLRPLADGAIRVRFTNLPLAEQPSLVLLKDLPEVHFSVKKTASRISISTKSLQAVFDLKTQALTFIDEAGKVILQEKPGTRSLRANSDAPDGDEVAEQSFISPYTEYLFGSGQFQDGYLNIRGLPRRLTQVNTQISIPFLLSSRGYGILWHNYGLTNLNPADTPIALTRASTGATSGVDVTTSSGTQHETRQEATFVGSFSLDHAGQQAFMLDVGQPMGRRHYVEIDGKAVVDESNFWLPPTTSWLTSLGAGPHSVKVIGVSKDHPSLFVRAANDLTTLRSPNASAIDYIVFAGPTSDDVIRRYRELTGPAPLMPLWAYGYIHCRERFHSQEELLDTAKEFRKRGIPMDVIVQDWQYWGHYGWNAMRFDEKDYPNPVSMVNDLHAMHVRLVVSVWSRIDPESEIGKEFTANSYYIPGTTWVDFFNPKAAALYWKDFSARMLSLGIDGWWQDATEPENDDLHGRTVTGSSGDDVRLIYPLLVNKTVYEGQRKDAPGKRVFILTRSAFSGQQRYSSATWSGDIGNDWDTLRRQIPAGLNFSASGLPYWTTDTGGFFRPGPSQFTDPAYHERFLRWLQFSTFTPLMRVHGYQTDTEFWRYGKEVEKISREYLDLRYRLLPYIYSEAAQVTLRGSTLMRPLVMDFPSDEKALSQTSEYMFGHNFLVAPVLASGVHQWDVYLPSNQHGWIDFWTGKHVDGGKTISADAPLDKLPLFVQAGSILPLAAPAQYTGQTATDPIEIRVYPGSDASFVLYEDEGTNYNYEKGMSSKIAFHWNDAKKVLEIAARSGTFPGVLATRQFQVNLVGRGGQQESVPGKLIDYTGNRVKVSLP